MIINFLNQYYKGESQDQNLSNLLNMYLEEDKDQGKFPVIAISRPGLSVFNSDSGSVVREGIYHKGIPYFVVDNKFYSYASNGTRTERGTLNTSSGAVSIAATSNQMVIVDGTNGYHYNTATNTFTTINDADFPSSPVTVTAQDETFLIGSASSAAVVGSDVGDGTSYSALSFNTKNGAIDYVGALVSYNQRIYVLGDYKSDAWYNSGAATFSFEPVGQDSFFNYGIAARKSVAQGRETIYFLAQQQGGGRCVVAMDGYKPIPISNRAIAKQITGLATVSDAIGFCYERKGHEFYVLIFPTEAVSYMYDTTTGLWSELNSYVSGAYTRYLANCHVYAYNKNLIGAYNSGTIYYLDDTVYQDNGAQIKRAITSPPGYAEGKKVFLHRVETVIQTGVGSSLPVTLSVSKDSGTTYTSTYTGNIPSSGGRLYWNRLGMTQDAFVLDLSTTANAKFVVLGATAEVRKGIN